MNENFSMFSNIRAYDGSLIICSKCSSDLNLCYMKWGYFECSSCIGNEKTARYRRRIKLNNKYIKKNMSLKEKPLAADCVIYYPKINNKKFK